MPTQTTNLTKFRDCYKTFPQLSEMKKLWASDYYDGPLSGMCLVDNQKCWFQCIEEYEEEGFPTPCGEWWRRFLIWKLTEEQQIIIEAAHTKFETMVGTHCNYDENGKRTGRFHYNETITTETFKRFYEESKLTTPIDITPTNDRIFGWYES